MPKNPRQLSEWRERRLARDEVGARLSLDLAFGLRDDTGWSQWSYFAANGESES